MEVGKGGKTNTREVNGGQCKEFSVNARHTDTLI